MVNRVHAVPPIKIAPRQAKISRQANDGNRVLKSGARGHEYRASDNRRCRDAPNPGHHGWLKTEHTSHEVREHFSH